MMVRFMRGTLILPTVPSIGKASWTLGLLVHIPPSSNILLQGPARKGTCLINQQAGVDAKTLKLKPKPELKSPSPKP